ncbi:hypothetical protein WMF39_14910 [Sorangium sp. So ce1504]|uniref:P-type ATPase n=1 Tax=Sorangium sp. So ce1504 TaxID=3133337 RepID=UPI003F6280A1
MVSQRDAPGPELPSPRSGALVVSTLAGLLGGAAAHLEGHTRLGDMLWAAGAVIALALVGARILADVLKKRAGVDVIALLAIGGALLLREYLAGAMIGAMMATGSALEGYAAARARRELSALLARAPRTAHRREGADVTTVPIGAVAPGDLLLVKAGEIVPVDGLVVGARALLDESALTGEPRPVEKAPGDRVGSGTTNAGAAFELRAVASADDPRPCRPCSISCAGTSFPSRIDPGATPGRRSPRARRENHRSLSYFSEPPRAPRRRGDRLRHAGQPRSGSSSGRGARGAPPRLDDAGGRAVAGIGAVGPGDAHHRPLERR